MAIKPNCFTQSLRHRWLGRYLSHTIRSDGLTLIECLVAIVVIAASMAAVTPVVVTAVAVRVQNQKAEQALRLAQAEVDKVRLAVERGTSEASIPSITQNQAAALVGPPTSAPDETLTASDPPTVAKVVNIDNDNDDEIDNDDEFDYVVQVFQVFKPDTTIDAFELGVRVYDYRRFEENKDNLETTPAKLSFTSGEGERVSRPLAVLYTTIVRSDSQNSLCDYTKYLEETPPASMNCAS